MAITLYFHELNPCTGRVFPLTRFVIFRLKNLQPSCGSLLDILQLLVYYSKVKILLLKNLEGDRS